MLRTHPWINEVLMAMSRLELSFFSTCPSWEPPEVIRCSNIRCFIPFTSATVFRVLDVLLWSKRPATHTAFWILHQPAYPLNAQNFVFTWIPAIISDSSLLPSPASSNQDYMISLTLQCYHFPRIQTSHSWPSSYGAHSIVCAFSAVSLQMMISGKTATI